ncbi:MAG: DUF5684 domain-containing protein [Bacilli bacterium]|jgi:hypothetical protein
MAIITLLIVNILIIMISRWFIFQKARRNQLFAIIPFYSDIVEFEIIGLPIWYTVLYIYFILSWFIYWLFPSFVEANIDIFYILSFFDYVVLVYYVFIRPGLLARVFGKPVLFEIGMVALPFIFYPILAFDKSKYLGYHKLTY